MPEPHDRFYTTSRDFTACAGDLLLVLVSSIGLALGLALVLNRGGLAKSLTVFKWLRVTAGWTWTWRLQGALVVAFSLLGLILGLQHVFFGVACSS